MKPLHSMRPAVRSLAMRSGLSLTSLALACMAGCSNGEAPASDDRSAAPSTSSPAGETGSLSFALTQPDNLEFDAFDYVITGPNYAKSGSIDVSRSTTVSTIIEAIPVASGYSITLVGASLAPAKVKCSGTATFDIAPGEVSRVPIAVQCKNDRPKLVPIPPLAPVALGLMLLAIGTARRRRET
jgi:hypothetical protein